MEESYDILIVGAGIIASSIAMALSERGQSDIGVVDCDLSGKWSSSERNSGGVRALWDQQVNVALSKKSISFYKSHALELGFQQKGYLWLYDEAGTEKMEGRREYFEQSGCPIEFLDHSKVSSRFPFLDRLEEVRMAAFSAEDGLINPNLLKNYYRKHSNESQVDWIDNHLVEQIEFEYERLSSVRLRALASEDEVEHFLVDRRSPENELMAKVKLRTLINATGSWAPRFGLLYGREIS